VDSHTFNRLAVSSEAFRNPHFRQRGIHCLRCIKGVTGFTCKNRTILPKARHGMKRPQVINVTFKNGKDSSRLPCACARKLRMCVSLTDGGADEGGSEDTDSTTESSEPERSLTGEEIGRWILVICSFTYPSPSLLF
jgi:hypothetical protein